jgi:hypothetical protein
MNWGQLKSSVLSAISFLDACLIFIRVKIVFYIGGRTLWVRDAHRMFRCRGCPAAGYFSCFAKKNNQKKAPLPRRPCGLPSAWQKNLAAA